jgi:hypothetical protein
VTRLVGCVPGVKTRAESLNRFTVNPTDSQGEPLVRLRSVSQWVDSGNRYLEFRFLNSTAEALKLADAGNRVIGDGFYASPLPRLGLDPVGIREPAASSERIEAALNFRRIVRLSRGFAL